MLAVWFWCFDLRLFTLWNFGLWVFALRLVCLVVKQFASWVNGNRLVFIALVVLGLKLLAGCLVVILLVFV